MEKLNGMRLGERMDKQTDGALVRTSLLLQLAKDILIDPFTH